MERMSRRLVEACPQHPRRSRILRMTAPEQLQTYRHT
jgi:hypothetical protein